METSALGDLPPVEGGGTRYTLAAEEELRLEAPFSVQKQPCILTLQQGSCELWGLELALHKKQVLTVEGGLKIALFTWHGCVIDVECETVDICYTTDETVCNVAFVNTHAQLEALRDQAAAALAVSGSSNNNNDNNSTNAYHCDGPRVLVCGPAESGKSTLCKILTAYACKLGRTPVLVDLDPHDAGLISIPGTLGACPMSWNSLTLESYATATGIPPNTASPLLLWHGQDPQINAASGGAASAASPSSSASAGDKGSSKNLPLSPELFRAQVDRLCNRIDARLAGDDLARASGMIVNTNGWIEDEGFELLLHAIQALRVDVVLVLGHDRLYSMLRSKISADPAAEGRRATKVIKLPRSGGVVSRGGDYIRRLRDRAIKHYFSGNLIDRPSAGAGSAMQRVQQLTPAATTLSISEVTIYKFSSIRLSASLLPVAAAQTSEAIQLVPILGGTKEETTDEYDEERIRQLLQHRVLAVCHRHAVQAYQQSGKASDLYLAGVAGFCNVEKVEMDKLHLLSPCAGSLPSNVLLMGNITWME